MVPGGVEVTDQPRRLRRGRENRHSLGVIDEVGPVGELERPRPDLVQVLPVATWFAARVIATRAPSSPWTRARSRAARRLSSSTRSQRSIVASSGPKIRSLISSETAAQRSTNALGHRELVPRSQFVQQEATHREEEPIPRGPRVGYEERGVDEAVQ